MAKDSDKYSDKEAKQRFDAMLKGALKSTRQPLKSLKTASAKRGVLKVKPTKPVE